MPPRTRYHEPIVQDAPPPEPELPTLPAVYVERAGVYLNSEDVSVYLSRLAEHYHAEGRVALLEAAQAFAGAAVVETAEDPAGPQGAVEALPAPVLPYEQPVSAEDLAEVARIELYPNADGKWETRACNADGFIVADGPSDFVRQVAEANALAKWPDVPVYELPDAMGDSVWNEQRSAVGASVGVLSGRPRPSPRRMFLTHYERPESARPV